MSIKIAIDHWEYDDIVGDEVHSSTNCLVVNDLDANLMECVRKIESKDCIAYFDSYYPEHFTEIAYEGHFPFILVNGKYEWHVPASEVSVRAFMDTHGIAEDGTITLYEGGIGGGVIDEYVSAIVEWMPIILNDIGMALTVKAIMKKIIPLYHKLIGKNNKVASPYEFLELLKSKDTWSMQELRSRTTLDEKTIECMLVLGGFEKLTGEKTYKISYAEDIADYTEIMEIEKKLWGEFGDENIKTENEEIDYDLADQDDDWDEEEYIIEDTIADLMYDIHRTNRCLTSLKIQSECCQSEAFDLMMKMVDCHVDNWNEYLHRGKKFRFIKARSALRDISQDELNKLVYSTDNLCEYVSCLCKSLEKRPGNDIVHEEKL